MRTVRLMNEYGVDLPLWSDVDLVDRTSEPHISIELEAALRAWAAVFCEYFSDGIRPGTGKPGWTDPVVAGPHLERGWEQARRLQAELGPDVRVVYDPWEHEPHPV